MAERRRAVALARHFREAEGLSVALLPLPKGPTSHPASAIWRQAARVDSFVMLRVMSVEVRDNPDESRYEVSVDGEIAGFAQYRLHPGRITIFHTEIDPAHEGGGLGGELARHALEDVRGRGLVLEPVCPFIAGYIRHHPDQYLDLVIPAMREKVMHGGGHE